MARVTWALGAKLVLWLAQGGEDLRKAARCPLCYSMVAARELKLVQVQRIHVPQVGFLACNVSVV